jgi:signal transduction histidine kinase
VSDESRLRVKEMVDRARNGEFVRCDIEVYGAYKGEKTIFVDFSLTPIRDETGKVAFLLPEGRDISQKIAIEAELTRKNEELQSALEKLREIDGFKTRFFANVSHELRTPLTLILGPLDQLLKEGGPYSEREQFQLSTARRNARALLQQVNDLLDLARIDDQKMPLAYVRTNVGLLIKEVVATFASAAEDKSIDVVVYCDEGLQADVDRAKFVRIVTNLLSNAFKFTPYGGRIACTLD